MGKYKVLSPVGGHGSRVFDHGEIVEEKDLRTPASELVKEGFLEVYSEEDSVEVPKSGEQETKLLISKEDDNFYNPNTKTDDEVEEEKLQAGAVKLDDNVQVLAPDEEKKSEASEETLRDEIKAELDAKGIKYNPKASKKQLYDLLEKSGK